MVITVNGDAESLPTPLDPSLQETVEFDWSQHGSGLIKDNSGYWMATSKD